MQVQILRMQIVFMIKELEADFLVPYTEFTKKQVATRNLELIGPEGKLYDFKAVLFVEKFWLDGH